MNPIGWKGKVLPTKETEIRSLRFYFWFSSEWTDLFMQFIYQGGRVL
jgi:hypothetical protein